MKLMNLKQYKKKALKNPAFKKEWNKRYRGQVNRKVLIEPIGDDDKIAYKATVFDTGAIVYGGSFKELEQGLLFEIDCEEKELNAFCRECGKLKVVHGKVLHPKLDKIHAKMFKTAFNTHYTSDGK